MLMCGGFYTAAARRAFRELEQSQLFAVAATRACHAERLRLERERLLQCLGTPRVNQHLCVDQRRSDGVEVKRSWNEPRLGRRHYGKKRQFGCYGSGEENRFRMRCRGMAAFDPRR